MRKIGYLLLAAGLCLGCHGSSTPTEAEIAKSAPPVISALSNPPTAIFEDAQGGRRFGTLPIAFNFVDPDGDLDQVIVTFPEGPARNPLSEVAGRMSGQASLQQALLLPAAGTKVVFTVQVTDKAGHVSNLLFGSYTAP
jgi:hypothetical protein